ncbi:hypothetical protein [Defluviimonas sp. SAOS-178_SWC]|uniref:hypothetical protein n=1 Tax=Defluviimonas sp. SAOS-178_SWC TaxID=3121287 RepID=UPI003221F429
MISAVFLENPGWVFFLAAGLVTAIGLGFSIVKEASRELPTQEEFGQVWSLLLRRSLLVSFALSLVVSGLIWVPANKAMLIWSGGEVLLTALLGTVISALAWLPADLWLMRYLQRKARG